MIYLKTPEEIEIQRESVLLVSKTLGLLAPLVKPGVTTLELDKIAEEFIRDNGGVPSFKGYRGYPSTLCTSVNEQVVHGIPSKKPLKNGDIISVDCGVLKNGFHGDHAYSFPVGEVKPEIMKLLRITHESLDMAVTQVCLGKRVGDIGYVVQQHVQKNGYSVVRELSGHGLGKDLHEDPPVFNFGKRGSGPILKEGIVVAIEPMINMGKKDVYQLNDGWTIVTRDGKPSAHFEHDVAMVNGQPEILSTFKYIYEALGISRQTAY